MSTHDHAGRTNAHRTGAPLQPHKATKRTWWVFAGFALIAAILLAVEHRAHLLGWLPWLFLLACPLMHRFMHRGHGHGDRAHRDRGGDQP